MNAHGVTVLRPTVEYVLAAVDAAADFHRATDEANASKNMATDVQLSPLTERLMIARQILVTTLAPTTEAVDG